MRQQPDGKMISGSCHCGAVKFDYPGEPEWLTACNCSLCRRYSTLWAYAGMDKIRLRADEGATTAYIQGDKTLAVHNCKTCGCTTHWVKLDAKPSSKMAVNFRLCDPEQIASVRIRHLDGADSWNYLD